MSFLSILPWIFNIEIKANDKDLSEVLWSLIAESQLQDPVVVAS